MKEIIALTGYAAVFGTLMAFGWTAQSNSSLPAPVEVQPRTERLPGPQVMQTGTCTPQPTPDHPGGNPKKK